MTDPLKSGDLVTCRVPYDRDPGNWNEVRTTRQEAIVEASVAVAATMRGAGLESDPSTLEIKDDWDPDFLKASIVFEVRAK